MRLLFLCCTLVVGYTSLPAQYFPVSSDSIELNIPKFLITHPEVAKVVEYESVKVDRKIAEKVVQNTYQIDRNNRRITYRSKARGGYFLEAKEINYTEDWRLLEVNHLSKEGKLVSAEQVYYDTLKNIRQTFTFKGKSLSKRRIKGDSVWTYKQVEYFNKKNYLARMIYSISQGGERKSKDFYRYKYGYNSDNKPLKMQVYQYDTDARNPELFAEHTYEYYREKEIETIKWATFKWEKEITKTYKDGFLFSVIIKEKNKNTLVQYFYESGFISGIEIQTDIKGKITTNYRNYEYYFN